MIRKILLTLGLIVSLCLGQETRKIVAVVDTGMPPEELVNPYLCNTEHYDLTGYGINDVHGHGTNVAGIIASQMNTKTHCIMIIKWWHSEETMKGNSVILRTIRAYTELLAKIKPAVVNLSLSGNTYFSNEINVFKTLTLLGTHVVVAAGNDGINLDDACISYPGCYLIHNKNFHVVGSRNATTGMNYQYSNRGSIVTDYEDGGYACGFGRCSTGTSQAAAILTSKLVSGKVQ